MAAVPAVAVNAKGVGKGPGKGPDLPPPQPAGPPAQQAGKGKGGKAPPGPPPAGSVGKGNSYKGPNVRPPFNAVVCNGLRKQTLEKDADCEFWIDKLRWGSIESYADAMQYTDERYRWKVRTEKKSIRSGHAYLGGYDTTKDKNYRPLEVMYVAMHARFAQDAQARKCLLGTVGHSLTSPSDEDWMRQTVWMSWYMKVLRRLREELRPEEEQDKDLLERLRGEFAITNFDEAGVAKKVRDIKADFEVVSTPIEIQAVTMAGEGYFVEVRMFEDMYDLKEKFAALLDSGAEARSLELLVHGAQVTDKETVWKLGLKDGDDIQVLVKGAKWQLNDLGGGAMAGQAKDELLTDIRRAAAARNARAM